MQFYSQTQAAVIISCTTPPSVSTMQRLHDGVGGPRDTAGRRIWTMEVIEAVRIAMAARRGTLGATAGDITVDASGSSVAGPAK